MKKYSELFKKKLRFFPLFCLRQKVVDGKISKNIALTSGGLSVHPNDTSPAESIKIVGFFSRPGGHVGVVLQYRKQVGSAWKVAFTMCE